MALSGVKTLTSERNAAYVKSNQGRRLNGTVEQNKDAFDKFPQLNMDKHNELVDLLIALGLDSISTDISSRYTKEETNTKISEETTGLIKTISYTKGDGKFKITTKGGVVTEIDTDLEKIPASFELMEIEGKTYLRITNQDGTYTQTEVTSLLNVYSFSDSDTIDFTESPKYSVTAIVKPNSITLDHLSLTAVSTLEGYVSAAAGSANSAAGSASAAETSANNASTFNQSAKGYSESAAASKESASESATSAGNAAIIANQRANAADTSAILSQSYAKGGTGTRVGEDADNAKYYMEQAKAAAGGDFATKTELTEGLETKVDKVSGKQLSTNDYTTTDKNKVANVPSNTTTELAKKAVTINKTATLGTSWTVKTGYVQQVVTVQGILATDTPIIDLITTTADFEAQEEAWGKVFKATAGANQITFYAKEATETSISLNIKVVR
nr:MAG TPA: Head fiber protein [Caudoviricetes sp.]